MELWTFNTEHIQEGETNSRIDIILIIWEDKFSLCECACLEKKIFKGLHQIFYVQIVFGYYFANNVGGATIWTNFDICM